MSRWRGRQRSLVSHWLGVDARVTRTDGGGEAPAPSRSVASRARLVVALVVLVLLVAVIADNTDDTRIGYALGDARAPLFVVLIATGIAGALIGWLLTHRPHRHH